MTLVLYGCGESLVLYPFIGLLFSETDAVQHGLHLVNLLLNFWSLWQFYIIGYNFSRVDVGLIVFLAKLVSDVSLDELLLLLDLFIWDLPGG